MVDGDDLIQAHEIMKPAADHRDTSFVRVSVFYAYHWGFLDYFLVVSTGS